MKYLRFFAQPNVFGRATKRSALLAGVMLCTFSYAYAQQVPQHIGYCNNCSSNAAWAERATATAPDQAPENGTPVTYPVYVIKPSNGEIRYFNVLVWYDYGDEGRPDSTDPVSELSAAGSNETLQSFLHKEAYPASGNSDIVFAMTRAWHAIEDLRIYAAQGVAATDLGPPVDGMSAPDFVGGEDSTAGYNRLNLESALQDYSLDRFNVLLEGAAIGLGSGLLGRFMGSGNFSFGTKIKVNFPDGSSIELQITGADHVVGEGIRLRLKALPETAKLSDGRHVPQSGGQFNGYGHAGPDPENQSLADLAGRFGWIITGGGGGQTCMSTTFACDNNMDEGTCVLICHL